MRPLVVGDGPGRESLEKQLGPSVFTGQLEGAELGRAIASADILLNPSTTEAFGNVNLEAMACGLAVVNADVATARALIRHGKKGLLLPATLDQLANGLEGLLADRNLRTNIRKAAISSPVIQSWPDVLDCVIQSYRKTMVAMN